MMKTRIVVLVLFFSFGHLFFIGCGPDDVRLLNLSSPVCSWIQKDILYRHGTEDQPSILNYQESALEIMFLTEAIASYSGGNTGGKIWARGTSRSYQRIDSISIVSSVDIDTIPAGAELAGSVFTFVHYPNLQLRDYGRSKDHFNEYIQNIRQSSESYFMYLRMREKFSATPFNLQMEFFLNDGFSLKCDCGWVQFL
ncbi:MAG: hypothetical protein JJU02_09875 [Cryomorphaceae bacterium]|nr:hypothetical protein [Cryomorphaceae bacterium]